MTLGWGWVGTVQDFLSTPHDRWLEALTRHHTELMGFRPDGGQVRAWRDEYDVMGEVLHDVLLVERDAARWGVAFEYELPLEGGRRPDVVVLAGGTVLVLEFKASPDRSQHISIKWPRTPETSPTTTRRPTTVPCGRSWCFRLRPSTP